MKKIIYIMALFAAFLITSCENESYRAFTETQVDIEESNVTFQAIGGTGTIVVASTEQSFTATSDQTWCTLSTSGNTVTVTVPENFSQSGRGALVTIRSGEKTNYVPVYQHAMYIELDSYDAVNFSGGGGSVSLGFECPLPVSVVSDIDWITGRVSGNNLILTATENPNFWGGRSARIKIVAGDVSTQLDVTQGAFELDPSVTSLNNFLNLRNNGTTSSRYKITEFSPRIAAIYNNLVTAYPILQEMRIEAPRSSYKLSVILRNFDGTTTTYYYWNATNGLEAINGSNSIAAFAFSGNSYSGTNPPYTTHAYHNELRAFFAAPTGFTIIPDAEKPNVFWFRSEANRTDYFKAEPASW